MSAPILYLDEATYRETARAIERHLEALLIDLGL